VGDSLTSADGLIGKRYERSESGYVLRDTIWLSQAEWDALTPEDFEAMQQKRWDEWFSFVTAPPVAVDPEV
jgi:hypothetical protein